MGQLLDVKSFTDASDISGSLLRETPTKLFPLFFYDKSDAQLTFTPMLWFRAHSRSLRKSATGAGVKIEINSRSVQLAILYLQPLACDR